MRFVKILKKIVLVLIVLSLLLITAYTYFISPDDYTFSSSQYITQKIPSVFDHFKIAFFSDCHLKTKYDIQRFSEIIDELNEKTFDMAIFGGDLYEGDAIETNEVSKILKKIDCQYGKFAVLGEKDNSTIEIIETLNEGGFEVLNNEQRTIYYKNKKISLLGLNGKNASKAITKENKNLFKIAVSHYPDTFDKNYKNIDLQLSGHSNGGYIYFPLLGSLITDENCNVYNHGSYTKSNAKLYVTNGLKGTSKIPYKFLSRNEIQFITLIYDQENINKN